MNMMTSLAVLRAGAHMVPRYLQRKDAPTIEELLLKHADKVKTMAEGFQNKDSELSQRLDEMRCEITEISQKMARRGGSGSDWYFTGAAQDQNWGASFAAADGLKEFSGSRSRPTRFSFDIKATLTSAVGSAGDLVVPGRDEVLIQPRRNLMVRNLLNVIRVESGSIEYPRMNSSTNNAAPVAEGNLKPESAMTFDLATVPIRTIAHWIPASRQILDDAPQLGDTINAELLYGLAYIEDLQLLKGDGTGQNINGIIPQATAFVAGTAIVSSPNKIDALLHAVLQCALQNLPADGIVLHPSDWISILSLKDAAGGYLISDPSERTDAKLFGLPVVQSLAMTPGTFLVGAFKMSAALYDRWDARIEVSTEHADFFTRNLVAILAEERVGLAVKRALGFVYGTFSAAITDLTS